MTRWLNCSEEVSVAEVKDDAVLDAQELWHLEFREDKSFPWKEVGVHRNDAAAVLRTYDYWCEHHKDVEVRILATTVKAEVADPEKMRADLALKNPAEDTSALQSE
jgi:hypothetical protein